MQRDGCNNFSLAASLKDIVALPYKCGSLPFQIGGCMNGAQSCGDWGKGSVRPYRQLLQNSVSRELMLASVQWEEK